MQMWLQWLLAGCTRILTLEPSVEAASCVPAEAEGYVLPSVGWGLASLYASRRLADRGDAVPQLSPAWFLASAWEATEFRCGTYVSPFTAVDDAIGDAGCLGIRHDNVYNEICRLYPDVFDCDEHAGQFAGDAPVASTLAVAWFAVAAHAMLGRFDDYDPDQYVLSATDPAAAELLTAALHFRGAWFAQAETVIDSCGNDVAACLEDELEAHVRGVDAKLEALADAPCAAPEVTDADRIAFVEALGARFVGFDTEAALAAARSAEPTLEATVEAVEQASPVVLACPEAELWSWYRLPCP